MVLAVATGYLTDWSRQLSSLREGLSGAAISTQLRAASVSHVLINQRSTRPPRMGRC